MREIMEKGRERESVCCVYVDWVVFSLGMRFRHNHRKHFSVAKKKSSESKMVSVCLQSWISSNFVDAGGINVYSVSICIRATETELQFGILKPTFEPNRKC